MYLYIDCLYCLIDRYKRRENNNNKSRIERKWENNIIRMFRVFYPSISFESNTILFIIIHCQINYALKIPSTRYHFYPENIAQVQRTYGSMQISFCLLFIVSTIKERWVIIFSCAHRNSRPLNSSKSNPYTVWPLCTHLDNQVERIHYPTTQRQWAHTSCPRVPLQGVHRCLPIT